MIIRNYTPFEKAVFSENREAVSEFLALGHDVNYQSPSGHTILMELACCIQDSRWAKKRKEMALFLIAQGADVNLKNKKNWTILNWAILANPYNDLKFWIKAGVHIDLASMAACKPLMIPLLKTCLHKEKDLIAAFTVLKTCLEVYPELSTDAYQEFNRYYSPPPKPNILQKIGAAFGKIPRFFMSPPKIDIHLALITAVKAGDKKQTLALLNQGASANTKNKYGQTVLSLAVDGRCAFEDLLPLFASLPEYHKVIQHKIKAESGYREIIKLLLTAGAELENEDEDLALFCAPLMIEAASTHLITDFDRALKMLEKCLKISPDLSDEINAQLATYYYRSQQKGSIKKAATYFAKINQQASFEGLKDLIDTARAGRHPFDIGLLKKAMLTQYTATEAERLNFTFPEFEGIRKMGRRF